MGACPERIISFQNYSVDMIASMIKAIEVPEEDEEKPRVLAFMCENDAYPALDIAGLKRRQYDASVRVIPLRCLGSLNIVWIADALSRGIDGVMLVGCKYGDDYQCHFTKGSELAQPPPGEREGDAAAAATGAGAAATDATGNQRVGQAAGIVQRLRGPDTGIGSESVQGVLSHGWTSV